MFSGIWLQIMPLARMAHIGHPAIVPTLLTSAASSQSVGRALPLAAVGVDDLPRPLQRRNIFANLIDSIV